jgi:hypothetical protein
VSPVGGWPGFHVRFWDDAVWGSAARTKLSKNSGNNQMTEKGGQEVLHGLLSSAHASCLPRKERSAFSFSMVVFCLLWWCGGEEEGIASPCSVVVPPPPLLLLLCRARVSADMHGDKRAYPSSNRCGLFSCHMCEGQKRLAPPPTPLPTPRTFHFASSQA